MAPVESACLMCVLKVNMSKMSCCLQRHLLFIYIVSDLLVLSENRNVIRVLLIAGSYYQYVWFPTITTLLPSTCLQHVTADYYTTLMHLNECHDLNWVFFILFFCHVWGWEVERLRVVCWFQWQYVTVSFKVCYLLQKRVWIH